MKAHHRTTLKITGTMLVFYAVSTGVLILINHQSGTWHPDVAWPVFWMIWLFAYWPIALAAFACFTITRTPRNITLLIHIAYILTTLAVMQVALSDDTSWPLVILKITGLVFAFTCITALPRRTN